MVSFTSVCQTNSVPLIEEAISNGILIDEKSLVTAIDTKIEKIVSLAIGLGASGAAWDSEHPNDGVLTHAVKTGKVAIVRAVLAMGAHPDSNTLPEAILQNRIDLVDVVIEAGGRCEKYDEEHETTTLTLAMDKLNEEIVDRVVLAGGTAVDNMTLTKACESGKKTLLSTALRLGALPNGKTLDVHVRGGLGPFKLREIIQLGARGGKETLENFLSNYPYDAPTVELLIGAGCEVTKNALKIHLNKMKEKTLPCAVPVLRLLLNGGAMPDERDVTFWFQTKRVKSSRINEWVLRGDDLTFCQMLSKGVNGTWSSESSSSKCAIS